MSFVTLKNQKFHLDNNENHQSENIIASKTGNNFMRKFYN